MALPALAATPAAQRLLVRGRVQGVGFRPFVYRLARELALAGWVQNTAAGVEVLVSGEPDVLQAFQERLGREAPATARIDSVIELPLGDEACLTPGFGIVESRPGLAQTEIGPDLATCPDCLEELFDRRDRRYRHAFINCTYCGPRFTLTRGLPYDRSQTSMAAFALCPRCATEYAHPADRRFHAQANCCPDCGPRLSLADAAGKIIACDDPIALALQRLHAGEILAIKGLGGYHLAVDARNAEAVARLRERKGREEKPFALMLANVASARELAHVDAQEAALLQSPQRPIVLLRKRAETEVALPGIAPDIAWLGVMLPYTPLQALLFFEAAGRPAGPAWRQRAQALALVMTSANPHDEPLVIDDTEAFSRLAGIADAYLGHDRAIVVRADDSVLRAAPGGAPAFLRRARGYTPSPILLAQEGPAVLALGAHLKNTVCATRGREAFLSQHLGDLDHARTRQAQREAAAHLLRVLEIRPQSIVCDLHPDYASTRLAQELAQELGVPLVAVQHHQAHIAAIAAEHRWSGPLLGLACDGSGYGSDGGLWGGELLRIDGGQMCRLGHLRPLPLPGGDRAAREPWRLAAAVLHTLGRGEEIAHRFAPRPGAALAQWLVAGRALPQTSSLGRVFDAAAGLLGIAQIMSFEGQAAMRLEGLAERFGPAEPLQEGYHLEAGQLDFLPLLAWLAEARGVERAAAVFHATVAKGLADWCIEAARREGLSTVALGGGCFLNQVLSGALSQTLEAAGLRVLGAQAAPPNDGGISLGQAWVARQTTREV
ncbi:Carbamoyltransferase HypF [Burkholderiales bacterium]|nr:Carbamoyltransferase HypF [Burkholderiales bacterium]